jgi:hypothetical protein
MPGHSGEIAAVAPDVDVIAGRFFVQLPPSRGAIRAGAGMWKPADTRKLLGQDDDMFTALMSVAQTSHAGGLLRFFLPSTRPSLVEWNGRHGWHESWQSKPKSVCFASDWLGNLILLDPRRTEAGARRVAFLDISTGTYDLGGDLAEFLEDLTENWEATLYKHMFDEYAAAGGERPAITESVGYVVPPVVGGNPEDVSNMKLVNLEVAVARAGVLHDRFATVTLGRRLAQLVRQ